MATRGEMLRELGRVRADSHDLRCVIDTHQQNAHKSGRVLHPRLRSLGHKRHLVAPFAEKANPQYPESGTAKLKERWRIETAPPRAWRMAVLHKVPGARDPIESQVATERFESARIKSYD